MRPSARIAAAAAACLAALVAAPAHAQDNRPVQCTLYADSDAAPDGFGSESQPYNSVQALVDATTSGHTGCLMAGSRFTENVDLSGKSGHRGSEIVIASQDPSNPATIEGVAGGVRPATVRFGADTSYVNVVGLRIVGRPAARASAAVVVNGAGNALIGNDITHAGAGTCVLVGESAAARATEIVVDGNAIHSCGGAPGDTAAAGIRAAYTSQLRVSGNYVYGNPRHGIALNPDADGGQITNNVVDGQGNGDQQGEGIQFGGDAGSASDNNEVARNVVSNNEAHQIAHSWQGPVGGGNTVRDNCLFSSGGQQDFRSPPTGYEIGSGNIHTDPQFLDRGAPPAGYGVTPSSPCRDRGPVPSLSVETYPPETNADPEAREVISVTFRATVDSRFQPGSFALALGRGSSLATFPGGNLQAVGGPVRVGVTVPGLEPSTSYAFRLSAENGSGTGRSIDTTYKTDAAPRIAVPLFNVSYDHAVKRGGRALTRIRVRPRPNNATRQDVNCVGPGCPFGNRPIRYVRRLEGRALRPGAEVTFVTRAQSPIGGLGGRAVSVRVVRRKGGPELLRKEGCIRPSFSRDPISGADIEPCLSFSRRVTLYPEKPRFRFLRVTRLPIGATAVVRCRGKGCPKLPRCRVARGGAARVVSLLGRERTARVGNVFTVTVLKRYTRPLLVRLALKPKNRAQSRIVQTSRFLRTRTRIPRRCASA